MCVKKFSTVTNRPYLPHTKYELENRNHDFNKSNNNNNNDNNNNKRVASTVAKRLKTRILES